MKFFGVFATAGLLLSGNKSSKNAQAQTFRRPAMFSMAKLKELAYGSDSF
ncbi:hypothetical protein [Flavobacterium caeni]|nr:hypothetical protein [Flavobacterium caeni]